MLPEALVPGDECPSLRESGNGTDELVGARGVDAGSRALTGRCVVEEHAAVRGSCDVCPSRCESGDAANEGVVAGAIEKSSRTLTICGIVKEEATKFGVAFHAH